MLMKRIARSEVPDNLRIFFTPIQFLQRTNRVSYRTKTHKLASHGVVSSGETDLLVSWVGVKDVSISCRMQLLNELFQGHFELKIFRPTK